MDGSDSTRSLRRPVFIVGSGRSGSSFFADLLSRHPDVAFLTGMSNRHPRRPGFNRAVLRALDIPGLGRLVRRKYGIREGYPFWEAHAPGFSTTTRDLGARDVTDRTRTSLRTAVRANLVPGRPRFLAKFTGWGRIGYLDEIFPEAEFVHLVRDGRDVANSFLQVGFWGGWEGPQNWKFGKLPDGLRQVWEEHDRSFVALAGICWRLAVGSIEEARDELSPDRFVEVRYEDLVARPREEIARVLQGCGLRRSDRHLEGIDREEVRDASGKHRRDLTARQQRVLDVVTRGARERYGYA